MKQQLLMPAKEALADSGVTGSWTGSDSSRKKFESFEGTPSTTPIESSLMKDVSLGDSNAGNLDSEPKEYTISDFSLIATAVTFGCPWFGVLALRSCQKCQEAVQRKDVIAARKHSTDALIFTFLGIIFVIICLLAVVVAINYLNLTWPESVAMALGGYSTDPMTSPPQPFTELHPDVVPALDASWWQKSADSDDVKRYEYVDTDKGQYYEYVDYDD